MDNLDDFGLAEERTSWTDDLEFTSASFELSSEPIRYFMTNVRLSALGDHFKLIEDIPGSARWGYSAIFQRDISDERVENELLDNYLFVASKFKFFNPLTIALLPYDGANQVILNAYTGTNTVQVDGNFRTETLGGVSIRARNMTTLGYIKWDRDRIIGAAIDGQHRLSALLKYATSPKRPKGVDPTKVRIPVVLLLFGSECNNILAQVREIFVDINKNAEAVSTARRVLLDDRDPFAVLARDLIKEAEWQEGLPYEIVDWKRDLPNPSSEHQLTTVIVLYEIIKQIFQDRLSILESELDLNAELTRKGLLPISVDMATAEGLSKPQMEVAVSRFQSRHKKFIIDVFSGIEPFKKFMKLLHDYTNGPELDKVMFRDYLFQPGNKRKAFKEQMLTQSFDPDIVVDQRLKNLRDIKDQAKSAELLFLSVGQRALFYYYRLLIKIYELDQDNNKISVGKKFANDLNDLIDNHSLFSRTKSVEILGKRFYIWRGICLRGDNVSVTSSAIDRLAFVIIMCIAAKHLGIGSTEEARAYASLNLKRPVDKIVTAYTDVWERQLEEEPAASVDDQTIGDESLSTSEDVDPDILSEVAEKRAIATVDTVLRMISD